MNIKLHKAILALQDSQSPVKEEFSFLDIDARAFLIVTIFYLISLLSIPLFNPGQLIWFATYPILMAAFLGLNYSTVFKDSLYVLPFIILIGIFNPLLYHQEAFKIGEISVSYGWSSFISIIIRGLLSVQSLIILVKASGFLNICRALNSLGCPKVISVQLMLLYRFLGILMIEALNMHRAVVARGYGRKSFPIKIWTQIVGALLLRAYHRAKSIYNAMVARGFYDQINFRDNKRWNYKDTLFCSLWVVILLVLHFYDISGFLFSRF